MNLPTSSSDSGRSVEPVTSARSKTPKPSGKGGRTDADLPLKLATASALASSGYFCKVNVNMSATSARGLADVTDVDVVAIRHDLTFRPTVLATSCKSGEARSLSPAREIFYLRGVLNYLNSDDGVVLFEKKSIPAHLRDLGRQLNVLVLSGDEIQGWTKALVNGIAPTGYFDATRFIEYVRAVFHPAFEAVSSYLQSDYWFFRDFRNLQNLIGHYKKQASLIDGSAHWHRIASLEVAAHLSLTVLDLCRYIRFVGLAGIEENTAAYLFGGATSFKARRDLYARVQQLLSSTGIVTPSGASLPPLEPAYTKGLAELLIHFLERPHSAVCVPQVFQDEIWRSLGASGATSSEDVNVLAAQKFAQDLLNLLKIAAGAAWTPQLIQSSSVPSPAPQKEKV